MFARGGISNGTTGPFKSSWQLGGLWDQPISARPESQVGFGVHQGRLGSSTRMAAWGAGAPLRVSETTFELTYSDSICSHLTIQPDVQYVLRPGAVPGARDALVTTLRLGVQF